MTEADLDRAFERIARVRVAVLGDFCVDHYLVIDPDWSEVSIETGLPDRGVAGERIGDAPTPELDRAALDRRYLKPTDGP